MTVIIDDKKTKYLMIMKNITNPWITIQDIRICSIRQVPLPRIVNNIYKSNPKGDTWFCRNCKTRGDKWYLMIHTLQSWDKKGKAKDTTSRFKKKRKKYSDD